MVTVISLGGSIVAPDGVDEVFLKNFVALIGEFLTQDDKRRFIFPWKKIYSGRRFARSWPGRRRRQPE